MSILIAEEGFRQRAGQDVTGWFCGYCNKTVKNAPAGICPLCHRAGALHTIVSQDRYHDQTKRIKEANAVQSFSPGYDPWSKESQMGTPLFPHQLRDILKKYLPSLVMKDGWNDVIKRKLKTFYIPYQWKFEDLPHISSIERNNSLKFICACEPDIMPEWTIITRDENGAPTGQIRGWREVLAIFYRMKLIPWIPDGGNRLSTWQIKQSQFQKEN